MNFDLRDLNVCLQVCVRACLCVMFLPPCVLGACVWACVREYFYVSVVRTCVYVCVSVCHTKALHNTAHKESSC